ncbi:magnesium transporter CorA [Flavobacterium akiainvivens]|uniref:Magnesium transporter CorA n=1 Tax=Flavobacterium akiainvivens TaxID=1202724 RepID=A0A0M8MAC6_9FLAO|nr:magnesium transporter CorA family protein [Flavobacterium akiainvivens]KOS06933.1 magnesium transporter CorA [Flavobacterium akiainvivens]SFQ69957.1 magnesium transporter [Flavobacterium akiainvivens]
MVTFYAKNNGLVPVQSLNEAQWISVVNPTDTEKDFILNELHIPEAFYNDIEDMDERPRIEDENGWQLIILRIPFKNSSTHLPYSTAPLGIIYKGSTFVTICFAKNAMIKDFVAYTQRKNIDIPDNYHLVLRLLLSSSIWFQKYIKQISLLIKAAEDNLEKSIRNEDLQKLLQIEKCLVYFITSLKGNEMLFNRIKNLKACKDTFDPDLVEDVEIELRQAQDMSTIYSDILTGTMDAYASVISNNLNIIMKRLTSISIILMIPTLVASFYGMNVPNALQENPHGLWVIALLSFIMSAVAVVLFKKKNLF